MKEIALLGVIAILSGCLPPQAKIRVRDPRPDVPWVHELGWWSHQEAILIRKCEVKVLDSRLGLFNAKSLVEVAIEGELKEEPRHRPYISKVHLAEKLTNAVRHVDAEAEFSIMPVVGVKDDEAYTGDPIPFSVKQELMLHSLSWGTNTFRFHCGPFKQEIQVVQRK